MKSLEAWEFIFSTAAQLPYCLHLGIVSHLLQFAVICKLTFVLIDVTRHSCENVQTVNSQTELNCNWCQLLITNISHSLLQRLVNDSREIRLETKVTEYSNHTYTGLAHHRLMQN